jgi:hypothetical protein
MYNRNFKEAQNIETKMMKKTTNKLSQMISNKKQNNPKSLKQTK